MVKAITLPNTLRAVAGLSVALALILLISGYIEDYTYRQAQLLALGTTAGDANAPAVSLLSPEQAAPTTQQAAPTTQQAAPTPRQEALPTQVPSVVPPAAILTVPAIGLRVAVSHGSTQDELRKGPGFFPARADPLGRIAIAGHQGRNGGPFRRIGQLKPGDVVTLEIAGRQYAYTVTSSHVVYERDWTLINEPEPALILQTCITGRRQYRLLVVAVPVQ